MLEGWAYYANNTAARLALSPVESDLCYQEDTREWHTFFQGNWVVVSTGILDSEHKPITGHSKIEKETRRIDL